MKNPRRLAVVFAFACSSTAGIVSAPAQLPSLSKQPWMGYFAGHVNKNFQIGLTSQGEVVLSPMGSKGVPLGHTNDVDIVIAVEEMMPGGKTVAKEIKVETLKSEQTATDDFDKVVIRGNTTGDASFEFTMEQNRGEIRMGGRLLDPGELTKNPIRFTLRTRIPNPYRHQKLDDKKDAKAFEKKLKDDRIELTWVDKKRKKLTLGDKVDARSKDINGPGIASAEIEISNLGGKKYIFGATENSVINFWNSKEAPLYEGFSVNWIPDPAKDPEGKARFVLEMK